MIIGAAGNDAQALALERRCHSARVLYDLVSVRRELGLERLAEADRLRGDGMHERPTLRVGEHRTVDVPAMLLRAEDERAARPPQRLVRRAGHDGRVGQRRRVCARSHQPGYVRHVHHEHGAHLFRYLREPREIYRPGVRRVSRHDDLRSDLPRLRRDGIVVQLFRLGVEAVGHEVVQLGREVDGAAVREVPALVQLQAHDGVADVAERGVRLHVGGRSGVRLYVHVLRPEQLLRAVDSQLFGDVDELAGAVVAASGVALRVLVGQWRALCLQHRAARVVLRRDEHDVPALPVRLLPDGLRDLGVTLHQHAHGNPPLSLMWESGHPERAGALNNLGHALQEQDMPRARTPANR